MLQHNSLYLLVATALIIACTVVATVAYSSSHSSNPRIIQGRTLFPDWNGPGGDFRPSTIQGIFEKTAREYGRMGLFRPKKCITLTLNSNSRQIQGKEVEEVVWKFSNDYYFRNMEVTSHGIDVVTWAPFIAVAEVKFRGENQPTIYAELVKPTAINPQTDSVNGELPCPE